MEIISKPCVFFCAPPWSSGCRAPPLGEILSGLIAVLRGDSAPLLTRVPIIGLIWLPGVRLTANCPIQGAAFLLPECPMPSKGHADAVPAVLRHTLIPASVESGAFTYLHGDQLPVVYVHRFRSSNLYAIDIYSLKVSLPGHKTNIISISFQWNTALSFWVILPPK